MGIIILRPTGEGGSSVTPFAVVGGTRLGVVSDASDGSYVRASPGMSMGFQSISVFNGVTGAGDVNPGLPSLAQIRQVRGCTRVQCDESCSNLAGYTPELAHIPTGWTFYSGGDHSAAIKAGGVVNAYTAWAPTARTASATWPPWTVDLVNNTRQQQFTSYFNPGIGLRTYDAWLEIDVNEAPRATVTAPAGIQTGTPTAVWTYSDPEGNAQERYHVKVFSQPAAGWASLDPETNTADRLLDAGAWASAATAHQISALYKKGVTYRAYVKVADVGSGSRYGHWWPGPDFKFESAGWGVMQ